MLYQELIRRKRDGDALAREEIGALVAGITDGSLSDAQLGALAMAIVLLGMTLSERVDLTTAMRDSGRVLRWDTGPVIDKHSTGGIGDTVSLLLAPALAACGALVPMISGRGLGHTGGTLDKLEAIPGYRTEIPIERFTQVVRQTGCAIIGQTADLAPADRRFYAVRDVTATVESRDLITASILSKKLAAGLSALVLDVKCGSGAFMATPEAAQALAQALVEVATRAGCATTALITDMDAPLAPAAGNALEVEHVLEVLQGQHTDGRLWQVSCALGGTALMLGGLAESRAAGAEAIARALRTGKAAERFAAMVRALGGPADLIEAPARHLARAPVIRDLSAPRAGWLQGFDTRALGLAVIELGGGRRQASDRIDPRVGLDQIVPVGQHLSRGAPILRVHAADAPSAEAALAACAAACRIREDDDRSPRPLILAHVD